MRHSLIVALATLVAAIVVSTAGATHAVSYFVGTTTSNQWRLSSSYAVRTYHYVISNSGCLPSYAQFQVANYNTAGAQINTHRSSFGSCGFTYPLTSNGLQARAACRIISSGAQVSRFVTCQSSYRH